MGAKTMKIVVQKEIKMNQLLKKRDVIVRNHFVEKNIVNVLIEGSIVLMNVIVLIVKIEFHMKIIRIIINLKRMIKFYKIWI